MAHIRLRRRIVTPLPTAHWIHAVLHKIEGDRWNSEYWYARTGGHQYADFDSDSAAELDAIARWLTPE